MGHHSAQLASAPPSDAPSMRIESSAPCERCEVVGADSIDHSCTVPAPYTVQQSVLAMEDSKIKIGKVNPEPAASFSAAFVLPITRDGRVLLTKAQRGQVIKYGMLGDAARSDETDLQCMSREAKESKGGDRATWNSIRADCKRA